MASCEGRARRARLGVATHAHYPFWLTVRAKKPNFGTETTVLNFGTETTVLNFGTETTVLNFGTETTVLNFGTETTVLNFGTETTVFNFGQFFPGSTRRP